MTISASERGYRKINLIAHTESLNINEKDAIVL